VTVENRAEYVKLALNYRLHEFDSAVSALREGMARVVPVPLLSLFTGFELETMVCGSPDIPLHLLKSVATYKGTEKMTICSIKKKGNFFTLTLFSEWIIEMDHHECGWRGRSTSDETFL
jgi:hypothetical protein